MKTKFSILIPAYKHKFLKECIDSILAQSYSCFEVIIVNDASPEDLDSIINLYKDSRILYFKNDKNCGAVDVVDNWNICLSHATGSYVICMGDDDLLCKNCLETYHELIEENPNIDIFHCRSYIINEQSRIIGLTPSWPLYESVYANIWHRINRMRVQFIGDFLYKTTPLKTKGGFYKLPLAWASDDISSYLAMGNKGIVHTEQPLFCYRQTEFTISNIGSSVYKIKAIKEEEKWYNSYINQFSPKTIIDNIYLENIKKELPHYFKTKVIETIAYTGIGKNILKDFIYWNRKRKDINLSLNELVYAMILAIKKRMTH